MPRPEPGPAERPSGILIAVETLFGAGPDAPQAHGDARAAIERLGWIGQPVVVVGEHLGGRRLPGDLQDRVSWVRSHLGVSNIAAVVVDEPHAGHPSEDDATATEGWARLGREWQADRLVMDRDSSVGPARRAGLAVVRIGARDPVPGPLVERADYEARDLLDAVRHMLTADVFGQPPEHRPTPGDEPGSV